jgi:hypothetical protein
MRVQHGLRTLINLGPCEPLEDDSVKKGQEFDIPSTNARVELIPDKNGGEPFRKLVLM